MNPLPTEFHSQDFIKVLLDFWPLAIVGAASGVFLRINVILRADTATAFFLKLILIAFPSAVTALVGVLCLDIIGLFTHFSISPTPELLTGIAGVFGGIGGQLFQLVLEFISRKLRKE